MRTNFSLKYTGKKIADSPPTTTSCTSRLVLPYRFVAVHTYRPESSIVSSLMVSVY